MVLSACGVDPPQAGAGAASTASAEGNQGGWTLDVVREKGGAGAPDPWQFMNFANVVAAGPNDQILFLERFGNRLTVFDRAGALVRRIGGVGPGPGEFSAPYSAGTHPDGDIWVSESFKGYYHVFDSTGVLRHTVPRPMRAVSAYGAPIRFDGGGRLIDIDIGGRVSVVHVEPASGEVAGYGPSAEEPPPPSVFGVLRPNSAQRAVSGRLLPRRRWAITPDGGLWSGLSTGGTVEWLGPDGALGRTLVLPPRPGRYHHWGHPGLP